ncbi:damage-control phosphatase ARMT1 family protein [Anaerostipes sp.]|uniref:damage-control phosphatase ARMT1 family protein n=1 Tax=Anaerostipes sp. TaxID=1872530 RepID=UPI0025C0C3C2|nr:ARMT1-like domain-containing protein [Anaerostipes sp.]MBS7007465.1 DUF89 family protein [Anaerostipes sp.]
MRTGTFCRQCLFKSEVRKVEQEHEEEKKQQFLDQVKKILEDEEMELSPPEYLAEFTEVYEQYFGSQTSFDPLKRHFNDLMLSKEQEIQQRIEASDDPVVTAIQAAQAGNYIDYIALGEIDSGQLESLLFKNGIKDLKPEVYQAFRKDLSEAKNLVYVTDNCGEIVVDKILIRELKKLYPRLHVTVIVRGAGVANDASIEDAEHVGMSDVADVIGNGTRIAGTSLNKISREAREILEKADVIIAKGQGNYETMSGCGLNVYYMFLCKCDYFVERFQGEYLEHMFIKER